MTLSRSLATSITAANSVMIWISVSSLIGHVHDVARELSHKVLKPLKIGLALENSPFGRLQSGRLWGHLGLVLSCLTLLDV